MRAVLRCNRPALAVVLALTMVAGLLAAGCPKKQEVAGPAPSVGAGGPARTETPKSDEEYVFIGISTGAEYWLAAKAGLEDGAKELGIRSQFTGPTTQNATEQAEVMAQITAKKPAGILIAPGRPDTLTPYINAAVEAGIPVICLDTDAPPPDCKRIAYFGTDNYNAGRRGAEILAGLIGGKGKVAISSRPGQWNLDERVRGYKEYFTEKAPGVAVVQVIDDKTEKAEGEKQATALLSRYPDLAGFAGVNAVSGLGIAAALKSLDKAGKVKVVAMDGDTGILDLIADGVIDASIAQRQYWMSYIGIAYLYGLNHGVFCKPGETKPGAEPIPAVIDTTVVEVNKTNLDQFRTPSQGAKETLRQDFKDVMAKAKGEAKPEPKAES